MQNISRGSHRQRNRQRGANSRGGPGGYCVCPNCGNREPHQRGFPCKDIRCPKCGTTMKRE